MNIEQQILTITSFQKDDPQKAQLYAEECLQNCKYDDPEEYAKLLLATAATHEQFGVYDPKGFDYIDQLLHFSLAHQLDRYYLQANNRKITHLLASDIIKAEEIMDDLSEMVKEKAHDEKMAEVILYYYYNRIQLNFRKQQQHQEMLLLAQECLSKAKAINSYATQILFLQSIAFLNSAMGDQRKTAIYLEEMINLSILNADFANVAGASGYLAYVYYNLKDYIKAEEKFSIAEEYSAKSKNDFALLNVLNRKLRMYIELKETEKAEKNIAAIEKLLPIVKSELENNQFLLLKSEYYAQKGDMKKAIELLESLAANEKFIANKHEAARLYQKLKEQYKLKGDYKNAYDYFQKFYDLKNELFNEEKTKSINELQSKYDLERKEALLKETKLQQLNAELKALKSQMNPHFVFNVMSTVDNLIEKGQTENARTSLHSFARLMRATLQQSQEDFTLIEDEVLLLENYIQLEKLAIGDTLQFEIIIDPNIDPAYDRVPAMLLQPIVENALKHGLRHKEGSKQLSISFQLNNDNLEIKIIDNGIGRAASAKINQYRKNHQSFAGSAIENRIKFLNEKEGVEKYYLLIEDLSEGTLVSIIINQ